MSPDASSRPWQAEMPDSQFQLMHDILGAPSPIGLEAAMTEDIIVPYVQKFMPSNWGLHRFRGNAGLVIDSGPEQDGFSVMVVGHSDKIRMQVRSIGEDGKVWIDSDSFLPGTLIGHEVLIFSEDPDEPGQYKTHSGGTVEALGAIHFAEPDIRTGRKGIRSEMLYVELHVHGENKKDQVLNAGIRPGNSIILDRKIKRGFSPDTFMGAYLDNGLGCFLVAEMARLLVESGAPKNIRFLGAIASYEEIGRFGSRVLASEFKPDILIGVDVSHDFVAAPGVGDKRHPPVAMGEGPTIAVGSIVNAYLNSTIMKVAKQIDVNLQPKVVGRDTGTDAMAAVLAGIDSAATSIGFPIRNMHTISESGHTGDILGATHLMTQTFLHMDGMNGGKGMNADDLRQGHPRLTR